MFSQNWYPRETSLLLTGLSANVSVFAFRIYNLDLKCTW